MFLFILPLSGQKKKEGGPFFSRKPAWATRAAQGAKGFRAMERPGETPRMREPQGFCLRRKQRGRKYKNHKCNRFGGFLKRAMRHVSEACRTTYIKGMAKAFAELPRA